MMDAVARCARSCSSRRHTDHSGMRRRVGALDVSTQAAGRRVSFCGRDVRESRRRGGRKSSGGMHAPRVFHQACTPWCAFRQHNTPATVHARALSLSLAGPTDEGESNRGGTEPRGVEGPAQSSMGGAPARLQRSKSAAARHAPRAWRRQRHRTASKKWHRTHILAWTCDAGGPHRRAGMPSTAADRDNTSIRFQSRWPLCGRTHEDAGARRRFCGVQQRTAGLLVRDDRQHAKGRARGLASAPASRVEAPRTPPLRWCESGQVIRSPLMGGVRPVSQHLWFKSWDSPTQF